MVRLQNNDEVNPTLWKQITTMEVNNTIPPRYFVLYAIEELVSTCGIKDRDLVVIKFP